MVHIMSFILSMILLWCIATLGNILIVIILTLLFSMPFILYRRFIRRPLNKIGVVIIYSLVLALLFALYDIVWAMIFFYGLLEFIKYMAITKKWKSDVK